MNFSINNQDLLEGLNVVTRALAARPAKQILDGVLIGKILTELIRKMPGGEVSVSVENQRTATIRCQKARSNLAIMSAAEYPEIMHLKNYQTVKIPQNKFKNMISHITFAIATDENRQILTGCLLEVSRNEARLVSLDGFRLAMQKLFQPFELPEDKHMIKVVIPGKVIQEMSRIIPEDDAFCTLIFDQGRMQCMFGNIRISSVLLAGEYIDYRRIVPTEFKTTAKANRDVVSDAIDRASLMAREGKSNLVKMSFRENSLRISSNAELGDVEEEMDAELNGSDIDIAFNAKYLSDVIRNVDEENLYMHFNSNVSPCVVRSAEHQDYLYLILPVRVFQ